MNTIEFILACGLFGMAGMLMSQLSWLRMILVIVFLSFGQILLRASGVFL